MHRLEGNVDKVAALADPVRRELYRFIADQSEPVSRDQAADAVGIARHQARFHLDRLEAEGLLVSDYARMTGRTGPGAGRTAKRYRRAHNDVTVNLPPREYELAGRLMADAIAESAVTGVPVVEALNTLAYDYGRGVGAAADGVPPSDPHAALHVAVDILSAHGYEPRYGFGEQDGEVYLTNCPFHAMAKAQTELACNMNQALISGVADALEPHCPQARLCPQENRCCVVLSPQPGSPPATPTD